MSHEYEEELVCSECGCGLCQQCGCCYNTGCQMCCCPTVTSDDDSETRLATLTRVMNEAFESGKLTKEAIDRAIVDFRKEHPYKSNEQSLGELS